jgi:hypothetical protein
MRVRKRTHTAGNRGPNGSGAANGRSSNHKGRNRSGGARRNRNHRNDQAQHPAGFWGDQSKLPPARTDVRMTDHPAAVPQSLGPPPLPGHESIAEHYFGVVYDRAVATAGALAAAGGLIDPDALVEERSH